MTDTVSLIFSKDRPLQLDLTIRSYYKQCVDHEESDIIVLWTASNEEFRNAYLKLSKEYVHISFLEQTDFKENLLYAMQYKKYVLFIVDDAIFINPFEIKKMESSMHVFPGILGFSLRLGHNTTHCYPISRTNQIPPLHKFADNIYMFNWTQVYDGDFGYPLELSSSMYRVNDIIDILEKYEYSNPNELEWIMDASKIGLRDLSFLMMYETSSCFCTPMNKVSHRNTNRSSIDDEYSVVSLLTKFKNGGIIDLNQFDGFIPNGCHQEFKFSITGG